MTAAVVVIAMLTIAAVAYIVAPIGRTRRSVEESDLESRAEEKKRVALTGILDLEEERDAGKLSEAEFADLRARYEREVIQALHEIDQGAEQGGFEDRLEREIAAARKRLRCATCGSPRGTETARCPSCGSSS